jgi:hypothetical protein
VRTTNSDTRRVVVAAVLAAALVLGVAGVASVACVSRSTPQSATANPARQAVQALADALAGSADTSYSADYAIADGTLVTMNQAPPRRKYSSGRSVYLLTPDDEYRCSATGCEHSPGADALSAGHTAAISALFPGGFVPPESVVALLAAEAERRGARAGRGARTIDGISADCVAVSAGGRTQAACVNASGILVAFDGFVGAAPIKMFLRRYSADVAPDAFTPPNPSARSKRNPSTTRRSGSTTPPPRHATVQGAHATEEGLDDGDQVVALR